ncbi:MAG TPA: tetratricopeptide repeat protein, partial [Bdellovibrionota bacterium]|nr:tetratricopeptide repeat protein [Bdellovibrionota bacterium]
IKNAPDKLARLFLRPHCILCALLAVTVIGCAEIARQNGVGGEEPENANKELEELRAERANRNVVVDDLRAEIRVLGGEIDSTRHDLGNRLDEVREEIRVLNERLAALESVDGRGAGGGEGVAWSRMWDDAEKAFESKKYAKASELYQKLLEKYPSSPIAGKAQFKLAESLFERKLFSGSILVFEEFKKKYPTSPDLARAYLQQARAFVKLEKKDEARLFYKKVVELYPHGSEAENAKAELKGLK